jgi:ribulose-phosphate 3-epimerase
MALIVPSLRAADLSRLREALDSAETLGASMIHIDVTDGHFEPEISMGQPVVRRVREATGLELEVHLLIERPERYIQDFIRAGANRVAFHAEATADAGRAINLVRSQGVKVGLALNCSTPVETGLALLEELDYLAILTSSGDGGEERFIWPAVEKVAAAAQERKRRGLKTAIEAEGGIGAREGEELVAAGADILVINSAISDKESLWVPMQGWGERGRKELRNAGLKASSHVQ